MGDMLTEDMQGLQELIDALEELERSTDETIKNLEEIRKQMWETTLETAVTHQL